MELSERQTKLKQIMNEIDEELGIGIGIKITDTTDVSEYVRLFLQEFTIDHDFTELLSIQDYINESESKSLLEKLNEI